MKLPPLRPAKKERELFKNEELRVTEYAGEVHISDEQAPALSDSVLIFKASTFWKMVRKCKKPKGLEE